MSGLLYRRIFMMQHLRVKLPGTLYFIDLTLNSETNTGKVLLERNAVEAQKTLSDLNPKSIQSVLLDLLDHKGLNPNPRLISRVLEDLDSTTTEAPTSPAEEPLSEMPPVVTKSEELPTSAVTMTSNPLLKVKDIIAAANSHMSKLDNLIGSPGLPVEIGSTMQAIQDLLVQAKNAINDVLSS
jgi:hypothetical protein